MIANRKVSKKQARAAAMKEKLRLERAAARNAAVDARIAAEAQVSVSYQCVERMHLLRPRARTRCALVYNLDNPYAL